MADKIDCFGLTDIGLKRQSNQDHFLIADLCKSMRVHLSSLGIDCESRIYGGSQGHLFLVADGMGGQPEGQCASTVAVEGLTKYLLNTLDWFFRLEEDSEDDFEDELRRAVQHCEEAILSVAASPSGSPSMGTTLTLAYVVWPRAFIVHVGDSRCYLFREQQQSQITRDHTMSNLIAERQGISESEEQLRGLRHILWNALGGETGRPTVDVSKLELQAGDALLLCSDGLHGVVEENQIAEALGQGATARNAAAALSRPPTARAAPTTSRRSSCSLGVWQTNMSKPTWKRKCHSTSCWAPPTRSRRSTTLPITKPSPSPPRRTKESSCLHDRSTCLADAVRAATYRLLTRCP